MARLRRLGMSSHLRFATVIVAAMAQAFAQSGKLVDKEIIGHVLRPEKLTADATHVSMLKTPAGFQVQKFAENLGKARILAVAPDGAVYVTRPQNGDCLLLRDADGDGRADQQIAVAKKPHLHGIAIHGDSVFFATIREVYVANRHSDGTLGELKEIAGNLPDGGQHPNRTLAVGPDGMLYVSVGSTCNACTDPNPEHATILRMKLDGSGREVFAKGLRNTIGFDWDPGSKQLFGMDHGTDWLGDDEQKEELNLITKSGDYGWPYVYADAKVNPRVDPPPGIDPEQHAKTTNKPVLLYTPHAAPMQMAFYTGAQFPDEYRGSAFVAMRGSWNRKPPSGYEVVRIRFQNGKPTTIAPFLTGFLVQQGGTWGYFGRPVGVAVAKDGSLLVSDDVNGVIYRVSSTGTDTRSRKP
jgi:glucose/arabinose dehydrogenase